MSSIVEKEMKFVFDKKFMQAFAVLKNKLIAALILTSLNWDFHFELMCNASDVAVEKRSFSTDFTKYTMQAYRWRKPDQLQ